MSFTICHSEGAKRPKNLRNYVKYGNEILPLHFVQAQNDSVGMFFNSPLNPPVAIGGGAYKEMVEDAYSTEMEGEELAGGDEDFPGLCQYDGQGHR